MTEQRPGNPAPKGTGQEFMERTKYRYIGKSDQEKGIRQPPLELPPDPAIPLFSLPRPDSLEIPPVDLRMAIERRTSIRTYAREPLSLDELGFLLWCTLGVKTIHGNLATLRTVPSAGARHAFETYILANDVDGLVPGLYRYLALSHRLQQTDTDPTLVIRITEACFNQQFMFRSGAVFLWTAVPYRMTWRYGERGYRDLHLDAGHVCQNLYLAAEAIGCGVCAIAAFDDDEMNRILGINGRDQFLIYLATVGKKGE
ncbi:SagB/ThcOx family dehydrogenase [uncultured Methanoregula sp.]|uniref:SagB/ThcOx family dehydrogenase n=1 Tax=uncultured Methanoregula sp. TaxID=1005933 RepID=UPI002AABE578|nr:SagB/ThcOx family dehydrogenase [uncultured Methanoregula sp.]